LRAHARKKSDATAAEKSKRESVAAGASVSLFSSPSADVDAAGSGRLRTNGCVSSYVLPSNDASKMSFTHPRACDALFPPLPSRGCG